MFIMPHSNTDIQNKTQNIKKHQNSIKKISTVWANAFTNYYLSITHSIAYIGYVDTAAHTQYNKKSAHLTIAEHCTSTN